MEINTKNLQDNPEYFGAFLNIAFHNVYKISKHFEEKYSGKGYFKEINIKFPNRENEDPAINKEKQNFLLNIFFNDLMKNEQQKKGLYLEFKKFLPCISIFEKIETVNIDYNKKGIGNNETTEKINSQEKHINFEELNNFLHDIFKNLNNLRNAYSHYFAYDIKNSTEIPNNRKEVLKFEEKDIKIVKELFEFIKTPFNERHQQKFDDQTKKFIETLPANNNYALFNNEFLSIFGISFFICLFLTAEQAIQFISKIRGLKDSRDNKKYTQLYFCFYAVKLPQEKLISSNDKFGLLMNIFNQLCFAPKELYHKLSKEDQQNIQTQRQNQEDEQRKRNIIENSVPEDEKGDQEWELLKESLRFYRKNDMFNKIILQYIDLFGKFENIRFQIHVGKLLLKDEYPKKLIKNNNESELRFLFKEVSVFCRLDKAVENPTLKEITQNTDLNEIKNLYDFVEKECFKTECTNLQKIMNFSPKYQYSKEHNKIGISIYGDKFGLTHSNNSFKHVNIIPDAFLSINELPKIALLIALNKQKAVENIIINFVTKTKNDSILNEEFLMNTQLGCNNLKRFSLNKKIENLSPEQKKKFEEYLNEKKNRNQEVKVKLKNTTVNTIYQMPRNYLDQIENIYLKTDQILESKIKNLKTAAKENIKNVLKFTKKNKPIEDGNLATILVKDILSMIVSKEIKQKTTPVYYNKLQYHFSKLTLFNFSENKKNMDIVIDILKELKIIDNLNEGHVFLDQTIIKDAKSTISFFITYFQKKQKWLAETFFIKVFKNNKKMDQFKFPTDKPIPYILLRTKKKLENKLKPDYNKNPINIPLNLLDKLLENTLKENINSLQHEFKFSKLLEIYLKKDKQDFYNKKRVYNFFNEKIEIVNPDKPIKKYLSNEIVNKILKNKENEPDFKLLLNKKNITINNDKKNLTEIILQKFNDLVTENEKIIRYHITKDRILKIVLEGILVTNDYGIDIRNNPINLNDYGLENSFWSKEITHTKEIYSKKIQFKGSIKRFGDFKKIENDRRLKGYFENCVDSNINEIKLDDILFEFKKYDIIRPKVFEKIFSIEKSIIDNQEAKDKFIEFLKQPDINQNYYEIGFLKYLEFLKSNDNLKYLCDFNSDDLVNLKEIRNMFFHSQYKKLTDKNTFNIDFVNHFLKIN